MTATSRRWAAALTAAAALTLTGCGGDNAGDNVDDRTAADYVDEYGGSLPAHEALDALTDCTELQQQFDTAASRHDTASAAGNVAAQEIATGFMAHADDRLEALGCY